jgi:N-acetyl-1-D-myo-inositol-2-amino-2-deoxy-alpha-D-glucopyranoside deacetylase
MSELPRDWRGLNVVVFIPHPDDESYAFGGLIALASDGGANVHVICATRGEGGERHDEGCRTALAVGRRRAAELRASCELLGVQSLRFWEGLRDGGLTSVSRGELRPCREFRRYRAHVAIVMGPDGVYGHPDHLVLHRWVRLAVASCAAERPVLVMPVFPRGLFLPQYQKCLEAGVLGDPPELDACQVGSDVARAQAVDIRPVAARKLAAIACHRSQLAGGDPRAMFPPRIVDSLLETEYYEVVGQMPEISRDAPERFSQGGRRR